MYAACLASILLRCFSCILAFCRTRLPRYIDFNADLYYFAGATPASHSRRDGLRIDGVLTASDGAPWRGIRPAAGRLADSLLHRDGGDCSSDAVGARSGAAAVMPAHAERQHRGCPTRSLALRALARLTCDVNTLAPPPMTFSTVPHDRSETLPCFQQCYQSEASLTTSRPS